MLPFKYFILDTRGLACLKRIKVVLLLITCTILISALFYVLVLSHEENKDTNMYSKTSRNQTCCEEGFFYKGNDQLIHFLSAITKEDMIFCLNPVCEHEMASSKNQDPDCMAAGCYPLYQILYHNKDIYLFVMHDINKEEICRLNIESGTKETIAELPFEPMIHTAVFDDDYLYCIAKIYAYVTEEGSSDLRPTLELVALNLKDGSYKILNDFELDSTIYDLDVCDGKMFVSSRNFGVYYIDLETLEYDVLVSKDSYMEYAYSGMCDSESFYYTNSYTDDVGIYNAVTGEKQIIFNLQIKEGYDAALVRAGNGKMMWSIYETTTKQGKYYLYDFNNNMSYESVELKSDDYSIREYDPYKSIIVTSKIVENEVLEVFSVYRENEFFDFGTGTEVN